MVHYIDVWNEVTLLKNVVGSNVAYAVVYTWKDGQVLGIICIKLPTLVLYLFEGHFY